MILHYRGKFPADKEIIAIIGPRGPSNNCSAEIIQHQRDCAMAYELARQAAKKGIVILSGLASGIDTAAHLGCLDEGGLTVAVVPFGLSAPVYPPENEKLAKDIINYGGCLVSQFAPEQPAVKWTFVARDKTQAMLSDKVLVVGTFPPNGVITGGTKYCARWARKLGKPLFHYRQIGNSFVVLRDKEVLIQK
ncbi:SMF family protein [Desulfotomaculum nigrificans CO-1-SRB]|uniref:SMF family protein n=1 Tax=Desulfotomaculum nigrificans (strain DSM 14880 / VKM B-2319 / CO-1-SRB) TaxID=868595 RepID=F6B5Z7_DESCC|nr:DNA-processing protein DprA [Desulfotomaculum nigrificans]AEF94316.1 SMF family protein [Desulfotomaculum nigrificans CO-1-SRB]